MVEGKESAAYALPFCAGNVNGMLLTGYGLISPGAAGPVLISTLSLTCISVVIFLIFKDSRLRLSKTSLAVAVFFAGWFCECSYFTVADIKGGTANFIVDAADRCANVLMAQISNLPFKNSDCNALASALITGDRSLLTEDLTEAFRLSGASHLLSLSGMHLGIIYMIITKPFMVMRKTGIPLIFRFFAITLSTGFYTIMTGAAASTVRAFLFILLSEAALVSGRRRKAVSALCFALTIQCALCPPVIKSASFQLSYLAVCGIILLYPKMRDLWPHDKKEKGPGNILYKIWDSAALTISCQIFTGPLAWLLFDSAPLYFLISNLIAVPLTTLTIPMVIGATVLDALGIMPGAALWCTELVLQALISSIEVVAGL